MNQEGDRQYPYKDEKQKGPFKMLDNKILEFSKHPILRNIYHRLAI